VDRIANIVEHRKHFEIDKEHDFDEGELRQKIQFMFPGEYRKIRFEYTGVSVQAILDKIPTAKVIDKVGDSKIIEAETFGTGVNMFLLSQGTRIKALYPPDFVTEMKNEIGSMYKMYNE
jgi:predicted DNA-binding transcriptional regulator YafY